MEPMSIEAVAVESRISGVEVINDLCDRIAERLTKSCDLREVDSYSGYAAKVQIELQLVDLGPVEVSAEIQVGTMNPSQPSERITLGESVAADEADSPMLERPADPAGVQEAPEIREKRFYAPRNRVRPLI
jgi:hypothetical protein